MTGNNARTICLSAVFMAIICVATMAVQIPIPLGYAHLGDCMVLLAAVFLDSKYAVIAAAVGSMLADFVTGFLIWCVPTFIIKGAMVLIYVCTFRRTGNIITSSALALLFMVAGYTVTGGMLYGGLLVGLASAPGLLLKAALNMVLFLFLAKYLAPIVRKIDGRR